MTFTPFEFKKLVAFSSIISLFGFVTVYFELVGQNSLLPFLSFLLIILIVMFNFYLNDIDYFSPLTIFSVMYVGYAFGGFYYTFAEDSFGKFVDFTTLPSDDVVELMQYGLLFAIVCYVFFGIGYSLATTKYKFINKSPNTRFWLFFSRNYMYLVTPLLLIGVFYWYVVAQKTTGSLIDLLIYFQAFRHLAADAGISTLPYHFYYAGIFIWLLGIAIANKKIGLSFILFSLLGMVINLTQGRITLAITFVIAQLFFVALLNERYKLRILYIFISLMIFAFMVYFLRIISNTLFIGNEISVFDKNVLDVLIGGGNIADLQQLVLVFSTFDINNVLLGVTYFDWLRNSFGGFFGIEPSSIGLIIKDLYVPETSGAPTPGAIGEAYANFNIAAPLFMFFIGLGFAFLYKKVMNSGNLLYLLIYSIFLARFVFIYPKVDSTMLSNFFWGAAPMSLALFIFYVSYRLVRT